MYTNTEQTIIVYPQIASEYWIHIIAWDEEKEGRKSGGDLTQISVTAEILVSQFEPQSLDYDNTIYGTVCAVGCDEGLEDPTDIFVIGGWKGDVIDLEFSSNEGDVNPDYGVHVYIKFETQFFSSDQVIYYKLDDSCDISNDGDCRVTLSYQFEQSEICMSHFIQPKEMIQSQMKRLRIIGFTAHIRIHYVMKMQTWMEMVYRIIWNISA